MEVNPLYVALPLGVALVWVLAIIAVRADKKARDRQELQAARDEAPLYTGECSELAAMFKKHGIKPKKKRKPRAH